MKTAMQELIEEIKKRPTEISTFNGFELLELIEPFLLKEKEQIYNDFKAGMNYANFSVPPNFNNEWDEYYNQTYNQNK